MDNVEASYDSTSKFWDAHRDYEVDWAEIIDRPYDDFEIICQSGSPSKIKLQHQWVNNEVATPSSISENLQGIKNSFKVVKSTASEFRNSNRNESNSKINSTPLASCERPYYPTKISKKSEFKPVDSQMEVTEMGSRTSKHLSPIIFIEKESKVTPMNESSEKKDISIIDAQLN